MNINHTDIKVLKGGMDKTITPCDENFVAGYVSDTRLMGVLVIGLLFGEGADPVKSIYKGPDFGMDPERTFRMFFYVDIEEYGLETCKWVKGDDPDMAYAVENKMIGGLGAKKVPITLREAKWLLQYYAKYNLEHNLPLPKGYNVYGFLIDQKVNLSEPDQYILMQKQCVKLVNDFELVNYFLMRICGKDFVGAGYLTNGKVEMDLFPEYKSGTFCKNDIIHVEKMHVYRSTSLLEWGSNYYILVTLVTVENGQIVAFEKVNSFKISTAEAAMILSQSEYVDVIDFLGDEDEKAQLFAHLLKHGTVKRYESGSLFMLFNDNNLHVARAHYRLNDDMIGNVFITDDNQIIAGANSLEQIRWTVSTLYQGIDHFSIGPSEKMEFTEPVLYDFIQSGIGDFFDFLDIITDL